MKKLVITGLFLLIALSAMGNNHENIINQGVINLRAGNTAKAIVLLKQFVTYYPNNPAGHYHLSRAYSKNNEGTRSLYHLKRAVTLDPALEKELAGPVIGEDVIGRVFVTNGVSGDVPLKPKACFDRDVPVIYASLEVVEAPGDTQVRVEWTYDTDRINHVSFGVQGSRNVITPLVMPDSGWQPGKYRLDVAVNNRENTGLEFYIF